MSETTPLIKAALNLRVGAGFDVYTNSIFRQTKQLSLTPVRACVAPVCDFKSEVEELPMIDFLGLVGEM